jgi:hypothetical protein
LDTASKTCKPCHATCETCVGAGLSACTAPCPDGRFMTLNTATTTITNDGTCSLCAVGCETCTAAGACTAFITGYAAANPTSTSPNCDTTAGYYFKAPTSGTIGTCEQCNTACLTCDGAGSSSCLTCKDGFYLTSSKTCAACTSPCLTCKESATTCTSKCADGFFYVSASKSCSPCAVGCDTCTAAANDGCTAKKTGYV